LTSQGRPDEGVPLKLRRAPSGTTMSFPASGGSTSIRSAVGLCAQARIGELLRPDRTRKSVGYSLFAAGQTPKPLKPGERRNRMAASLSKRVR